jgi:hypothetical protein
VVEVLPPPGRIRPDRLEVAVRVGADPDVRPRRRDDERADALEQLRVLDAAAALVEVLEAAPPAATRDPRRRAAHPAKTAHGAEFPPGGGA